MWKHDTPCALEKIIVVEVSGHVDFINVFHDVDSLLYTVTNIYSKALHLHLLNVVKTDFTLTSIHNIQKST